MQKWYKLDNAAKIFPAVTNKNRPYMFRVSAILKEKIDKDILQKALNEIIERFTSFNVRLKKGFFWHYLETNPNQPLVFLEDSYVNKAINKKETNDFLFRTLYYENKISVEFFHSITDGKGALTFLNALVYEYLILKGEKIDPEHKIWTKDIEVRYDETVDQYVKNYNKKDLKKAKEDSAYHIKADIYKDNYQAIIHGYLKLDELRKVAQNYGVTLTEYLSGVLVYANYQYLKGKDFKKPFRLILPVNMRQFISTKTLRNFVLYMRINYDFNEELTLEDIFSITKKGFKEELVKDKLLSTLASNVKFEKNIINRSVPLFIKTFFMKLVFNFVGEVLNSFAFSNLGLVDLPKEMEPYIDRYQFIIGTSTDCPKAMAAVSFKNTVTINFVSLMIDNDIEKHFFNTLRKDGLTVEIETNELEVSI